MVQLPKNHVLFRELVGKLVFPIQDVFFYGKIIMLGLVDALTEFKPSQVVCFDEGLKANAQSAERELVFRAVRGDTV